MNGLGIALGCFGTCCINVGNNLQALGLQKQQTSGSKKKHPTWVLGTCLFAFASVIQFVAFAFAPASVIAPLESLQFVANLVFGRVVNKKTVTAKMVAGTCCILLGTAGAVIFGPHGDVSLTVDCLIDFWTATGWIVYVCAAGGIALGAEGLHRWYRTRNLAKRPLPGEL